MSEEIKTMTIPAMVAEAKATGLIDEKGDAALDFERKVAQERIQHLKKLCEKRIISYELMRTEITIVQQEFNKRIIELGFDPETLS
jgi:hypothetical protein